MRSFSALRPALFALSLHALVGAGGVACQPVKLPTEMPGPIGCGKRDPSVSGPAMLSVAQQTTLKNQGMPMRLEDNDKGGKTWVYIRQNGSVFGEQVTAEMFTFDDRGLLVEQKTELQKYAGK
jgi:hypothetical protein